MTHQLPWTLRSMAWVDYLSPRGMVPDQYLDWEIYKCIFIKLKHGLYPIDPEGLPTEPMDVWDYEEEPDIYYDEDLLRSEID